MAIDFNSWDLKPQTVIMSPQQWRDFVCWGLLESGMPEEAANAEADRRLSEALQAWGMEKLWQEEDRRFLAYLDEVISSSKN